MNTKNILITIGIVIVSGLFLTSLSKIQSTLLSIKYLVESSKNEPEIIAGASLDNRRFSSMSTTSQVIVSTVSSRISASSTRPYAIYTNYGPNDVYLCFNADRACTASSATVFLASTTGKTYEIGVGVNEYVGSITAISIGGSSLVNVSEVR